MIDRQQLAEALACLDPRDREILYLSLRRRVPDQDLAEVFEASEGDVARMRTAAIERLSNEMGVQRGSDLGHMLKELLDPGTWQVKPVPRDRSRAPGEGHRPVGATGVESHGEPARPPVLGILQERTDADRPPSPSRGQAAARRLMVGAAVALALLVPAGVVAALTGQPGVEGTGAGGDSGVRPFEPHPGGLDQPFPSEPKAAGRYPVAHIERRTVLYRKPAGKAGTRIGAKTEFDSPRVLSVVEQRKGWLAVLAPELDNGEVGWIREETVERLGSVDVSVHVDLSERELEVRRDDDPVRRVKVGVGRSTNPTPRGRYAVTDKLRVSDPDSPYGCCVLALSGHQVKLPEGWPGGDRLAVHATRDTSGLGQAVSLGCLRTDPRDTRWMLEAVPLGAPVFVEA